MDLETDKAHRNKVLLNAEPNGKLEVFLRFFVFYNTTN